MQNLVPFIGKTVSVKTEPDNDWLNGTLVEITRESLVLDIPGALFSAVIPLRYVVNVTGV